MSTNKDLAGVFAQMAAILEIRGESGFKVNAHSRVARALKDLTTDVATIADDEKALVAIDGVGKGSAKKIREYVETGAIAEHAELLESIPTGLLEVLEIPGLGPKTVRLMWESAGITDMASLEAGRLLTHPQTFRQKLVHAVRLCTRNVLRNDRLPPRRTTLNHRDIQIAEHTQRQRARNRRRRHHQRVRC